MQNQSTEADAQWSILKLLQWAASYFESNKIESPRSGAEILLAHALGCERIDLYLRYDQPLSNAELAMFKVLVKRRLNREPVAYITGVRGFWGLDLAVSPHVLIPRPDTETLVESVLASVSPGAGRSSEEAPDSEKFSILELGTGSGAIILSIASECPRASCVALDRSPEAAKMARKNALDCGCADRVAFLVGDWFSALKAGSLVFDFIVSNPPYIPTSDIDDLQDEINRYEPLLALDGGEDGLDCLREIISTAPLFLKPGGYLFLEMGFDQADMVAMISRQAGVYSEVEIIKDYAGKDRVAKLRFDVS